MSDIVIKAAGWLGPDGFGNDLAGLANWPVPLGEALRRGELEELRWSDLFNSEAPRFARMDWLSRLGLMAVEQLETRFEAWDAPDREQTAVCVETAVFGCSFAFVVSFFMVLAGCLAGFLASPASAAPVKTARRASVRIFLIISIYRPHRPELPGSWLPWRLPRQYGCRSCRSLFPTGWTLPASG